MLPPEKNEVRKPTKTISGITPVAVMLPPRRCNHGECIYCPNLDVPQSYTPKSPVVMRASRVDYKAKEQVEARIEAFKAMNHPVEKIEIIIMGGTFLEYPKDFQYKFIKGIYDGLNGKKSKNLEEAKKINETSEHRCVALCIETRPDVCSEYIERMRDFGCTRVELGVQILDDNVYDKVNRGHKIKDVINATKNLRNAGFKIGYHIMPGLPGSSIKKDIKKFKKIFSDSMFKPDQLKLYPCQVMPGSVLEKWYWKGNYVPYSLEEIKKVLVEMLKKTPRYCRVMRVMREIPPEYITAGTTKIDLRAEIERELRERKAKLKEIRYREVGFAMQYKKEDEIDKNLKLKITKYNASNGKEYFLEIVNENDILFGLLRLRIKNKEAMIRELHIYGKALKLGEEGKISQHKGLGKWLMNKAEEISKKQGCKKISVISGVGVREYYKKLGYELEGEYMVRFL